MRYLLRFAPNLASSHSVSTYTVENLRTIKRDHEAKFSEPARAILATIRDWTTYETPSYPANLKKANRVLGWQLEDTELAESLPKVRKFIDDLRNVPTTSRKIAGLLAARRQRLTRDLKRLQRDNYELLADDAVEALRISQNEFRRHAAILEQHGFLDFDEIEHGRTSIILGAAGDWLTWEDIALFSEKQSIPIENFTVELRFDLLDD